MVCNFYIFEFYPYGSVLKTEGHRILTICGYLHLRHYDMFFLEEDWCLSR